MAGAEITFQGALSVAKVVEIPDRCRDALQAGGLLIDRGAACRTEEPARTRYPVPKCQLTLEPARKLRNDFRAVCLRVGRVEDRRKTRREVKPRGELVASVHNVGGAGQIGFVADQVLCGFRRGEPVGRKQCIQNSRTRSHQIVVATVQADREGPAAGFLWGSLKGRCPQRDFAAKPVQPESVVVAQSVEGGGSFSSGSTRAFSGGCALLFA